MMAVLYYQTSVLSFALRPRLGPAEGFANDSTLFPCFCCCFPILFTSLHLARTPLFGAARLKVINAIVGGLGGPPHRTSRPYWCKHRFRHMSLSATDYLIVSTHSHESQWGRLLVTVWIQFDRNDIHLIR